MAKRCCIESIDRISELPDELLVSILSLLSLKEAVATSILSRRWRYLWTFTTKLDFDGCDFLRKVWSLAELWEVYRSIDFDEIRTGSGDVEESWNYIAWVDNVLRFHKGYTVEEFRVDFFMSEFHCEHLNRWLRFASAKNVETLDLNLRWKLCRSPNRYALPYQLFKNFKQLRTMRMQWVNVSGEGLKFLLRSCPLLEELSVSQSDDLRELKIIGPLKLKRLTINYCRFLTSLEIRDSNLEYLMLHAKPFSPCVLENVPRLVEMHVGWSLLRHLKDFVSMFSRHLPRLEKLTLNASCKEFFFERRAWMFLNSVEMINLRELVIKYYVGQDMNVNLLSLPYFAGASPLLQSLVIEACGAEDILRSPFYLRAGDIIRSPFYSRRIGRRQWVGRLNKYPHLRHVQFIGFRGFWMEFGLVAEFLENGGAVEEVNLDLRRRDNPWMSYSYLWPNSVSGVFSLGYPHSPEIRKFYSEEHMKKLLQEIVPLNRDVRVNIL